MFDFKKMTELMKNAQELQGRMKEGLRNKSVESVAGAGLVKVVMNGDFEINSVEIDDALLAMNDKKLMQDLLCSACNDATRKAKDLVKEQAQSMAGDLGLPNR